MTHDRLTSRDHRADDPHESDVDRPATDPARPAARPADAKAPVSVIVPVKNEAENLRRCLPALAWADEVFVVDSQSTDDDRRGRRRARRHGRPVPLQRHLSQEEELGARQPAVPQRMGPDRRRRRGGRPRAGRGDRPADRGGRGRRLLSEHEVFLPRPADPPLRLCRGVEPAALQAPPGPLREDARRPRRRDRRQRGPRARRARGPGAPPGPRARPPRLSDDRGLGREAQPLRALGSRDVRAVPARADPARRSAAASGSSGGSRRSTSGCRCARSSASSTPTSSGWGSSTASPAWSSARCWRSTTSWPGRTSTSDRSARTRKRELRPARSTRRAAGQDRRIGRSYRTSARTERIDSVKRLGLEAAIEVRRRTQRPAVSAELAGVFGILE